MAALGTDAFEWWQPRRHGTAGLPEAVDAARHALPGNRLVDHLARCALEYRCYTAQNTFFRRYEAALPASPACNADCLGCISLQSDGAVPSPQERMGFAPTVAELAGLADHFLEGDEAAIVSFGQGCEGEALTRGRAVVEATAAIRARHPAATIHVNTNGSRPRVLERMVAAGCDSVRISAISFTETIFRAYYRPVGYGLEEVIECGRIVMRRREVRSASTCSPSPGSPTPRRSWRRPSPPAPRWGSTRSSGGASTSITTGSIEELPPMEEGIGMAAAMETVRRRLPGVAHGNFTRPVAHPG